MKTHTFPPLYANASKGGTKYWEISVKEKPHGADIVTQHGLSPAHSATLRPQKLQTTTDEIRKGKNVGRSNETTPWEQAVSEAGSKWQKKIDKGYAEHISDADKSENARPMLAHEFQKRGGYLKDGDPVFLQPKRDGVRAVATCTKSGVSLLSRGGKPIPGVPHIVKELKRLMAPGNMLDGELFSKGLLLEEIMSMVTKAPKGQEHERLELWVFDRPSERTQGYGRRFVWSWQPSGTPHVRKVETLSIDFSKKVLETYHGMCIKDGFEGVVIRPNDNSPYEHKKSANLLKYKKFQDAEFKVVGFHEGRGKLKGHLAAFEMEIKTQDGMKTFKAKMDGETAVLKKFWKTRAGCIGKMATVKFQTLTKYGIPRFPVVKCIREEE